MALLLDALVALLVSCSPLVDPATGVKLVRHESGGNPYAIGVNGPFIVRPQPASAAQAVATAKFLLATPGVRSIDLGLGMLNTNNLARLGLTVEQAFEPWANLGAMQTVLLGSYRRWEQVDGPGELALQKALSEYNTGPPHKGLLNGYVRKIYMQPVK
jgi:type IV secretion system protein VirB1